MCQEVFQILQSLDAQNLDAQLAIQCAPVITGLKLSNLLMVDRCCAGKVEHMLRETGFCCNRVMETTDRTAILVYTGYWKVYAGTEQKRSLFHQFECAREHLIQLVHQGERMVDIIRKYRANQLRMAG